MFAPYHLKQRSVNKLQFTGNISRFKVSVKSAVQFFSLRKTQENGIL